MLLFRGFRLAILKAYGYAYIDFDMQRVTAKEKTEFHSTISMRELPNARNQEVAIHMWCIVVNIFPRSIPDIAHIGNYLNPPPKVDI